MGIYLKLLDLEGILVKMVVLLLVLEMERMLIGWVVLQPALRLGLDLTHEGKHLDLDLYMQ